jgi:hypothetical protein
MQMNITAQVQQVINQLKMCRTEDERQKLLNDVKSNPQLFAQVINKVRDVSACASEMARTCTLEYRDNNISINNNSNNSSSNRMDNGSSNARTACHRNGRN